MKRILCLLLGLCLFCSGCCPEQKPDVRTFFAMDTVMELSLWGDGGKQTGERIEKLIRDLEKTWSAEDPDSLLSSLNRGEGEAEGENRELLQKLQEFRIFTDGAFDSRLLALSELWNFSSEHPSVPGEKEIQQALSHREWDLGASLKGYACSRAADILKESGVQRAVLNLGGNIQTYGSKPDGSPWQIAVTDPRGQEPMGVLSVSGTVCIATSGDYQRYFEQDGVRYHHILDPETGYPARSGMISVTVICEDGLLADVLSTALFVMGPEKAERFWQENPGFEAAWVTEDGSVSATEGSGFSGCTHEVIGREN